MDKLDYARVEKVLVKWLQEKVREAGCRGAIFGLSGGIDAAVVAVLSQKAFGDDALGVIMPCYSNKEDEEDALLLAETFGLRYIKRDLGPVLDQYLKVFNEEERDPQNLALANMKPRLRMVTLYYYAAKYNYLVVGTDNWSELTIGYFTKYGDGGVDLIPLGRLVKTEVRELGRHLGIPEKIIQKTPSAGLWPGQSDEKELGISYGELDNYILTGEASAEAKEIIESLARKNAHKLQPIPMPAREELE